MRPISHQLTLFVTFLPFMIGCSISGEGMPWEAKRVLSNAENLELISLQPYPIESEEDGDFYDWKVLGSMEVKDTATRRRLIDALLKADRDNDGSEAASCFEPRHALRIISGSVRYDFVVCFECLQAAVYRDDVKFGHFLLDDSPRSLFNDVLRSADIEIAPSIFESVTEEEQSEADSEKSAT